MNAGKIPQLDTVQDGVSAMSIRDKQVCSLLRHAVQDVLQRGLSDPRIRGLVSVTSIDLSPDRRNATVNVSIMPAEYESLTIHGLKSAASHIQHLAANKVRMRRFPKLTFKRDQTIKRSGEILAAIASNGIDDSLSCLSSDDSIQSHEGEA